MLLVPMGTVTDDVIHGLRREAGRSSLGEGTVSVFLTKAIPSAFLHQLTNHHLP